MFFLAYSGFFKIPDLGPNWLHLLLAVAKLIKCPKNIYSNKKETSDFHGTVSFDPVKMLQQK